MGTSKVVSLVAGDRKIVILRGQFWAMPSSVAVGLVSRFFVLGDERQRAAPRQRDIARASRESRYKTGIFPTPWGTPDLAINHEEPENTRPLACRKRETNV